MSNKSLGGYIAGGYGAPNVWLPVKVWGSVTELSLSSGCSFILSDGSLPGGVRVVSPFVSPAGLANGRFVSVEGICTAPRDGRRRVEVVDSGSIEVL